jgi:hypothetical protein
MVLYFRVNVFVQTYSDKNGGQQYHVGDRVKTQRNDYYIIDFVKREYLQGKLHDIKGDIDQLKNINSNQVKIGKEFYTCVKQSQFVPNERRLNNRSTTGTKLLSIRPTYPHRAAVQ